MFKILMLSLLSTIGSFVYADELSHIQSAISRVQSEISRVRTNIGRVESDIRRVTSETRRVQNERSRVDSEVRRVESDKSRAESAITSVISQTSSVHEKTTKLKETAEGYREDERKFQEEYKRLEGKKAEVKVEIANLLQKVHTLELNISVTEKEKSLLQDLLRDLQNFDDRHVKFQEQYRIIAEAFEKIQAMHLKWISSFKGLMAGFVPDFSNITDMEAFKEAEGRIRIFRTKSLSLDSFGPEEDFLLKQVKSHLDSVRQEQDTIRSFAIKEDFTVFSTYRNPQIYIDNFKVYDQALNGYFHKISKMESLIYEQGRKRTYLLNSVPSLWGRLNQANLQVAAIENGLDLTKQALIGLRGDETLYGDLKSSFESKQDNFRKALYEDLMPLHAHRLALEGKELVRIHEIQLKKTNLAKAVRPYLEDLLEKYRVIFESGLAESQKISDKPEPYFKERKRLTTLYGKRHSQKFSDRCHGLHQKILEYQDNSIQSESDYKEFRSHCP